MRHAIVLAVVAALGAPAGAAAQATGGTQPGAAAPTGVHGTPSRPAKKPEKKKASQGQDASGKPTPEQVQAAARTKSIFFFAMESCERPERCDASLRDDAERRFLDACRLCAPPERCEAERDAIRQGKAKRRSNPCAE